MAMEVAVRNPERYRGILEVINKYEGKILNDSCILDIYADLFESKVIETGLFDVENSTLQQIKNFIKANLTHKNEWGFPEGYQAAFTRYLKTLSELGFIYAQYNEEIKISEVSKSWLKCEIEDAEVFALQCMRFWRKSPYRRVLNDFNYFKFVLKVLLELEKKQKTLSYPQFILTLFSDKGDVEEFLSLIETNKFGHDIDQMYKFIVKQYNLIDENHSKVNKQSTVCNDYGNTVFRVLQLTGLISINSKPGILTMSINEFKRELLEKLLKIEFSLSESAKEDELLYFNEIGYFDKSLKEIIVSSREKEQESVEDYNSTMSVLVKEYGITEDLLENWIIALSNNKNDASAFWYIQKPLKFEFFISLMMYMKYGKDLKIRPNYKTDTNGIPYQHAPGNIGDISVSSDTINWLLEVTLLKNKIQQYNMETSDCIRHFEQKENLKNYLTFIAPIIHTDTANYYNNEIINLILNKKTNTYIKTLTTEEFLALAESKMILQSMEQHKEQIYQKLKSSIS